ncbi:MAG: HD domain-containing protein, partial [Clostridia bacterium]
MVVTISSFQELWSNIEKSGIQYDTALIEKAFLLADKSHKNQLRKSGEPYIIHPLSVSATLVEMGMDTPSIVAGLLHDVVEDTDVTLQEIHKEFGPDVEKLIDGLTKISKIEYSTREEMQAENIRKMLMAMAEDIRVIIVKFADRMHNLSTLEYV